MINFWKLYKKAAPFFQISSEIRKGAAQSLTAYDWHSSKDASQHVCIYGTIKKHVCIYGTIKNRVHILPLIFKLISVYFSWICHKKRFRCNLFQVASKVLNKHGAASQIWTGDLILTKDALYRLSYSSIFISASASPGQLPYYIIESANCQAFFAKKAGFCLPEEAPAAAYGGRRFFLVF